MSQLPFLDDVKNGDPVFNEVYRVRGSRWCVNVSWSGGGAMLLDGHRQEMETELLRKRFGERALDEVSAREVCDWVRETLT